MFYSAKEEILANTVVYPMSRIISPICISFNFKYSKLLFVTLFRYAIIEEQNRKVEFLKHFLSEALLRNADEIW